MNRLLNKCGLCGSTADPLQHEDFCTPHAIAQYSVNNRNNEIAVMRGLQAAVRGGTRPLVSPGALPVRHGQCVALHAIIGSPKACT
ncbi:MAG: hypothetical protein M0P72_11355 [Metallibacterium scheffleri]|jgi:hypothetical protein|uniref:hypothetical protein n=1 Tax=Metallibacterium scheffleri TaxID=993689 RepID=UPI0026ECB94A|nr:hypothetical protein [Metallibacterium scheffleri]MCK9367730.1 hypothetical protein [Metallibacterium scheffleri]